MGTALQQGLADGTYLAFQFLGRDQLSAEAPGSEVACAPYSHDPSQLHLDLIYSQVAFPARFI